MALTSEQIDGEAAEGGARGLARAMAGFARIDGRIGARQVTAAAMLLAADLTAILELVAHGLWPLALPLYAAGALLLLRLAGLGHDCAHGTLFRAPWANRWTGRAIGLVWLLPFARWRDDHLAHHAASGDLDRRGLGDIPLMTVEEYRSAPPPVRLRYRVLRHPLVLFLLGPPLYFMVGYRLPGGGASRPAAVGRSTILTSAALAVLVAVVVAAAGWRALVLGWLPCFVPATWIAMWVFFVHHCFPEAYHRRSAEWRPADAALRGASFYDVPRWLAWFLAGNGYHHVHHLHPGIPNHQVAACHRAVPALRSARRIGLRESLALARLALYCERRRALVDFARADTG